MAHHYEIYGEVLSSQVRLDELTPSSANPTLTLSRAAGRDFFDASMERLPGRASCFWLHGRQIVCDSGARLDTFSVRDLLTSVAIPAVLRRLGHTVLRATGVLWRGKAVLLIGGSSAGKSTAASLLIARDGLLLCDGIAVVRVTTEGQPLILSGNPIIRLWPEMLNSVGLRARDLGLVNAGLEKRALHLGTRFALGTFPVSRLCFLAPNHGAFPPEVSLSVADRIALLSRAMSRPPVWSSHTFDAKGHSRILLALSRLPDARMLHHGSSGDPDSGLVEDIIRDLK